MKVQTSPVANRELKITIELEETVVEAALKEAAAVAAQTIKIPGFRKSKVPYRVIERYVGRPALLSQVHEQLANRTIQSYLQDNPLGEVESMGVEDIQDDPVVYTYRLALEPYTELGDFSTLRIEPRELDLTEEEREQEKSNLMKRFAETKQVEEAANWQDWVTLDVKSVILDDENNPTDEVVLEEEDWWVTLEEEGPLQPPGLEKEIVGMKPGQSRTFDLTYSDDSSSVHAGKSVRFDIEIKSVERAVDPVWDAALLAKGIEDEAGDRPLTEYEEVFWNRLKFAKANRVFQEELEEAFVALEEVSILEFPKSSVDAQVDSLISQRMQGLEQFGIRNLETYLRYVQQTPEEFRQSLEPEAKASLKQNLLIWDFIEKQKIEIPEDQQERLERQSAEQAALMMNSDVGKRPDVTLEGLQATLLQHSMSETLRHLGRNALLESFTEGAHSLVRHAEDMPKLNLTPTDEVEGQTAEEVVQDVAEAEPEISHDAA